MRLSKRSLAIALVADLVGCSSAEHPGRAHESSAEHLTRAYESATVRMRIDTWRGYEVAAGQDLVLVSSHYVSSVPIVFDGIAGYSLFIQVDPQRISKGAVVAIPSGGNRAYLHTLNAPLYRNVEVFGVVRFVDLQSTGVSVEVDLRSKGESWAKSGIESYRYARHSCFGKVDWACEFYVK